MSSADSGLQRLSGRLLDGLREKPGPLPVSLPDPQTLKLPIRAIMFGEGRFLRAFVGQFFQQANNAGLSAGRLAVVQPIAEGQIHHLAAQDGLYTVALQGPTDHGPTDHGLTGHGPTDHGLTDHGLTDTAQIVGSAGACLSAYNHWGRVEDLAASEQVRFLISNTTEAGIAPSDRDNPLDRPPRSFPAKVAALLAHRYKRLGGRGAPGFIMLPCELIDSNGTRLREAIGELADRWEWDPELTDWALRRNTYVNTLVDRIVTGPPADADIPDWEKRLGYRDRMLDLAEPFHLWLMEGEDWLLDTLPLDQAGLDVKTVPDLAPYRSRKVRLLNGAHTALTALGLLLGLETVRQAMEHLLLGPFVQELMDVEVVPGLGGDVEENLGFSLTVRRRFANPFVAHRLTDISLNTSSKVAVRLLPSLQAAILQRVPSTRRLSLALAANLALYNPQAGCSPKDNDENLKRLSAPFSDGPPDTQRETLQVTRALLSLADIWGRDLNRMAGVTRQVGHALWFLLHEQTEEALRWAMEPTEPA